jgi:hypothetical protein
MVRESRSQRKVLSCNRLPVLALSGQYGIMRWSKFELVSVSSLWRMVK